MIAPTHTSDTPTRAHKERGWGRVILRAAGLLLAILVAWISLFLVGPIGFLLVLTAILVVDRWRGRSRRRERRAETRARRHDNLVRAIGRGGLDTAPYRPLRRTDRTNPEKTALGPRQPKAFGNGFPRGRI